MVSVFTAPHARLPVLLGGGTRAGHHLFIVVSSGRREGTAARTRPFKGEMWKGWSSGHDMKSLYKKSGNMQINVRQVRMVIKNGSD